MKIKIQQWDVYSLGDHAIVFSLEAKVDTYNVQSITALATFIKTKNIHGIIDIIPSYHTLTIVYNITQFLKNNTSIIEQLTQFSNEVLNDFNKQKNANKKQNNQLIKVPVCYDLIFGIDIEHLSVAKNISIADIISIHTSTIYEVYSIGFLPGFTYMGIVDEKIQMPRHEKPRIHVLAGSVGIAGLQTGIYPSNSPGGWQIIGRTPWNIFNRDEKILAKFKVGDWVQFYAIDKNDFDKMNEHK
jgi:KipI family sensor histidine kinase inhibitor